ncbi:MAG: protein-L-isoaspartate(D-aspartate) O-methyltransferase [Candidatus Binatia bacterium]
MFSKIKPSRWHLLGTVFLLLQVPRTLPAAAIESRQGEKHDPFLTPRRHMVERDLKGRGIKDPRVLAAMEAIPRHLFVPDRQKGAAYDDRPLPIGAGQTISQPYIVAYMSELLGLKGHEKVLEIGTGSGYQAAVLARLAAQVYSIEIIPSLSEQAKRLLIEQLAFTNIHLKVGDGFFGWEEPAPFDAILLTAASPKVPEPLWRQLRDGGQIILPLGDPGQTQRLTRVRKAAGKQVVEPLGDVIFVPLTGAIQKRSQ